MPWLGFNFGLLLAYLGASNVGDGQISQYPAKIRNGKKTIGHIPLGNRRTGRPAAALSGRTPSSGIGGKPSALRNTEWAGLADVGIRY